MAAIASAAAGVGPPRLIDQIGAQLSLVQPLEGGALDW